MVLLDIDEYIWPEYTPSPPTQGPSSSASSPTKDNDRGGDGLIAPGDDRRARGGRRLFRSISNDHDDDEERSLYSDGPPPAATILPSHVPRFSPRAKACGAAAGLVVVLALLAAALLAAGLAGPTTQHGASSSSSSEGNSTTTAAAPPLSPAQSPSSQGSAAGDPTRPSSSSSSSASSSSGTTAPARRPSDDENPEDDPCPTELAAVRACFVDNENGDANNATNSTTTTNSAYISASVAQSVCEGCLAQRWPARSSSTPSSSSSVCGLDDDSVCQEMLQCECGSSCAGIVAAYLMCATNCQPPSGDDDLEEAWKAIPASCQQLLEMDNPPQSSVDLLPPELSFGGQGEAENQPTTSTVAPSAAPSASSESDGASSVSSSPSMPPTPVPRCHNSSKTFDECVDPIQGDSASCLLCVLSYWPSTMANTTSAATTNNTGSSTSIPYPPCDAIFVNATCVGLAECDAYCGGCRNEYVDFIACEVETCNGASSDAFDCR